MALGPDDTAQSSVDMENSDPPNLKENPGPEFVEGTLHGWLAVVGGSLVLFATFGNMQSFGGKILSIDFYTRTYFPEQSASTISWIGSIQLALQFIVGVISGKLFDKGFFHVLMVSGSLLLLFSSFMLSLAKPHQFYQALLSQGFGMGIGSGLLFLPSLSITSHYFRRRRAVAMGIMISSEIFFQFNDRSDIFAKGGSLGGVVYSILLNKILPREDLGFPWAVRLFLGYLGVFIPYFYLQLFSFNQGVSVGFLTWAIPILNAGAMVGRLMPNFLADRYGPLNAIIPSGLISGALMWALLGVHSVAGVTVFALFYGFVSGSFLSLTSPTVAAFSTSPTMNDIGLRIGISCFFIGFALLSGNPIAGALLSPPAYTWWKPLTFGSVVLVAGSVLILYARQAVVKRRGRQLV
ncbi:MFS general substrate transporter [Mycena belliarum]|uniref:MFS general substrate transporter n=1 Tax=Mycena belliarum TaxID=1033014 RepID=A0AAD6U911_9AGAR|nr:MFS general substrate transporter [Mycena belliae]